MESNTPKHARPAMQRARAILVAGLLVVVVASLGMQSAVAASAPDAPGLSSATPAVGKIRVAFSAPSSDGGAPIRGYQASCNSIDGGTNGSSAFSLRSPLVVKHLSQGATYECVVVARNAVGVGPASPPSVPVRVPDVPDAPTISNVGPAAHLVTVSYILGADNGEPITGVRAICAPSGAGTIKSSKYSLTNPLSLRVTPQGGTYTCTAVARNAVGVSEPSSAFVADGEPGLITDLAGASNQDLQTTLTFTPPLDNGDPIRFYNVNVNGAQQGAALAADDTVPLSENGQSYEIQIQPCNQHCGPWSNVATATPDAAPTAPELSGDVSAGNVFNFSWGSPASNGCDLSQMGWSIDAPSGPWTFVALGPGSTSVTGAFGDTHTLYMFVGDSCGLSATASTAATSALAFTFNNYGTATKGIPMCRGNPGFPNSNPGGTFSETMTVPAGVGTINHVMIQIDPDSRVTATLTLYVNGTQRARTSAAAAGDTKFSFTDVAVSPGDTVEVHVAFSATFGQIITIYEAGNPGGTFAVTNTCANDPNETFTTTSTGLRATVSGWS